MDQFKTCGNLITRDMDTYLVNSVEQLENIHLIVQALSSCRENNASDSGYFRLAIDCNLRPLVSDNLINFILSSESLGNLLFEGVDVYKPVLVFKNKKVKSRGSESNLLFESKKLSKFVWIRQPKQHHSVGTNGFKNVSRNIVSSLTSLEATADNISRESNADNNNHSYDYCFRDGGEDNILEEMLEPYNDQHHRVFLGYQEDVEFERPYVVLPQPSIFDVVSAKIIDDFLNPEEVRDSPPPNNYGASTTASGLLQQKSLANNISQKDMDSNQDYSHVAETAKDGIEEEDGEEEEVEEEEKDRLGEDEEDSDEEDEDDDDDDDDDNDDDDNGDNDNLDKNGDELNHSDSSGSILKHCRKILEKHNNLKFEMDSSDLDVLYKAEQFYKRIIRNKNNLNSHKSVQLKNFQWLTDVTIKTPTFHPRQLNPSTPSPSSSSSEDEAVPIATPNSPSSSSFYFTTSNSLQVPLSFSPFQTAKVVLNNFSKTHHHQTGTRKTSGRQRLGSNSCACQHDWSHEVNIINYLIWGAPRIWIIISDPTAIQKLIDHFQSNEHINYEMEQKGSNDKKKISRNLLNNASCSILSSPSSSLNEDDDMQFYVMPELLLKLQIQFKIIVQRPGDLITLRSGTFFQTLNTGFNYCSSIKTMLLESEAKLMQRLIEKQATLDNCECVESLSERFFKLKGVSNMEDLQTKIERIKKNSRTKFAKIFKGPLFRSDGDVKDISIRYNHPTLIYKKFTACSQRQSSLPPPRPSTSFSRKRSRPDLLIEPVNGGANLENSRSNTVDGPKNLKIVKYSTVPVSNPLPFSLNGHGTVKFITCNGNSGEYGKQKTPKKIFKCRICERIFKRKDIYENHENRHSGDRTEFKCDICGKIYFHKSNVYRHKHVAHKNTATNK